MIFDEVPHSSPIVFSLMFVVALPLLGQAIEPPSPQQLSAITARGRQLAGYDAVAWRATDVLMATNPDSSLLGRYIARQTVTGWRVAFGRLAADLSAFRIAYEASQKTSTSRAFDIHARRPLVSDTGYYLHAARALNLAERDFGAPSRRFNAAAIPIKTGGWWVYLLPAQDREGVFPHGGDVRYRISADGLRIEEKRQLHNGVLEMGPPPKGAENGMHTVLLDSAPTDTDVFYVLTRLPQLPELVVTKPFLFLVTIDGSISYLGRR